MTTTDNVPPTFVELLSAIQRRGGVPCERAPEAYYPDPYKEIAPRDAVELAKNLCSTCSISELCLRVALSEQITDGIWGGLTPDERRLLRRS